MMNASAQILLRTASRRAAATPLTGLARTTAVRSASVLSAAPTFQGSGFKAVGLRSALLSWSAASPAATASGRAAFGVRSMSTFLSSYDAHVSERAEMADGHGVAPQPLTVAQVTDLIDEMKAGGGGDGDRVRTLF